MASAESSPPMPFPDVAAAATEFARGFNHCYYQPLHVAILKGDWEATKAFLDNDPTALTAKVTMYGMTVLHVAAVGSQWDLIEKLVQHVPKHVLAERDLTGDTCLHYVAAGGSIRAAKALLAKNPSLTQVTNFDGSTPLIYSISFSTGCKDMVWYLVLKTTDEGPGCPFSGPSAGELVTLLTSTGFHDITMYLLQYHPNLATIANSNGSIVLNILSKLPSHFRSGHELGFWGSCIYHFAPVELDCLPPIKLRKDLKDSYGDSSYHFGSTIWNFLQILVPDMKRVREAKLRHVYAMRLVEFVCSKALSMSDFQLLQSFVSKKIIFNATSSGIVEILRSCFHILNDLVWTSFPNERNVVQIAIENRRQKVFSLLSKMPTICKLAMLVISGDTTSHLAARFAPQVTSISGAAFQMQRELQWFKEVEKLDSPGNSEVENQDGKTPWQVFTEEHKTLLDEGKIWMKDTSNSCMLVATLIATVAFAAAITVPGGNSQDKGIPIFLPDSTFMVFVVSDALALFSSMASLLMFLAILNARYTEEDFLMALPKRLILGMASLFFAIVTTIIAFGAALSLLLHERLKWAPIPLALLGCVPIALFINLQLPLLIQMIISTYGSNIYHGESLW